jgi:hypothetical protein
MSVEGNKALVRRSIEGENRADLGMLEDCDGTTTSITTRIIQPCGSLASAC